MIKLALFNHKGGVGKTTLGVNLAAALDRAGERVLIVDADPQCNATAFFLDEKYLDQLLDESVDDEEGNTLYSAVYPVIRGRGSARTIDLIRVWDGRNVFLAPGDVLLSEYEERLPTAWAQCFAREERAFDVVAAMSEVVQMLAQDCEATVVIFDVGPNVGALNRVVLMDSSHVVVPIAADLYSLRALRTVGQSLSKWLEDTDQIRAIGKALGGVPLLPGNPKVLGYVTHQYNIYRRSSTSAFADWERKIARRVSRDLVDVIKKVDEGLVPSDGVFKLGEIKNYHSLAPEAQNHGLAIGELRGLTNTGNYERVDHARKSFDELAASILKRIDAME